MRYPIIPDDVTIPSIRSTTTGEPQTTSFVDYLDGFVWQWAGWRTGGDDVRRHSVSLFAKFAGSYEPVRDGDKIVAMRHVLAAGTVVELTDSEHEVLCRAIDACEIPKHLTIPLMPFAIAMHTAGSAAPSQTAASAAPASAP